jgi:signal-transduction protein with cAMP-binding, CBS, and nucleotidyltransferase domain
MAKHKISSVVVVDEDGKPVGILTDKDAIRTISEKRNALDLELKTVMSKPIISINTFTSIKMTLTIMALKNINHLPVVENEKLVGIVSEKDIFRFVLQHEGLILEMLSETAPTLSKEILEKFSTQWAITGVWPEPHRAGR